MYMYIPGDITTFESRLHQLALTLQDFNSFIAEGNSYSATLPLINRWNKEFIKKSTPIFGNVYYDNPPISIGKGMQGVGGDSMGGVGGDEIEGV